MEEIRVLLYVESRYKVDRKRIKNTVQSVLLSQGIKGPAEVSIAIVGDRKMRSIHKKFKGEDKTTNILSFPLLEGEQTYLPTDVLRLGDIMLSYPMVIKDASRDEMLVDDKLDELLRHGLLHLAGVHH